MELIFNAKAMNQVFLCRSIVATPRQGPQKRVITGTITKTIGLAQCFVIEKNCHIDVGVQEFDSIAIVLAMFARPQAALDRHRPNVEVNWVD